MLRDAEVVSIFSTKPIVIRRFAIAVASSTKQAMHWLPLTMCLLFSIETIDLLPRSITHLQRPKSRLHASICVITGTQHATSAMSKTVRLFDGMISETERSGALVLLDPGLGLVRARGISLGGHGSRHIACTRASSRSDWASTLMSTEDNQLLQLRKGEMEGHRIRKAKDNGIQQG